jgi:hypothetical protein
MRCSLLAAPQLTDSLTDAEAVDTGRDQLGSAVSS